MSFGSYPATLMVVKGMNRKPIARRSCWYWFGGWGKARDSPVASRSGSAAKAGKLQKWKKIFENRWVKARVMWMALILTHGII